MQPKKIFVIVGTRPEAIKLAPLIDQFKKDTHRWTTKVVATAQHREMLDQVLSLFDIRADYDLNIMRAGQSLFDVTSRALNGIKGVFESELPDFVFVQGDTTTTFAGALAAFYCRVPVGHVEAGLRTGNMYSPFPEEKNRCLTSQLSTLHFPPTPSAAANLAREGFAPEDILVTGNTVIDALLAVAAQKMDLGAIPVPTDILNGDKLILLTAHRRESFGGPIERAFAAIAKIAREYSDWHFVYPVHPNANVKVPAERLFGSIANVHLIEPLDYKPFVHLMKRAHIVITDSGGIQEEAPSLGAPVLVMREVTERPEAVEAGTVKLVGTDAAVIDRELRRLMDSRAARDEMASAVSPYGDGRASERHEAQLANYFFGGPRPVPFGAG